MRAVGAHFFFIALHGSLHSLFIVDGSSFSLCVVAKGDKKNKSSGVSEQIWDGLFWFLLRANCQTTGKRYFWSIFASWILRNMKAREWRGSVSRYKYININISAGSSIDLLLHSVLMLVFCIFLAAWKSDKTIKREKMKILPHVLTAK